MNKYKSGTILSLAFIAIGVNAAQFESYNERKFKTLSLTSSIKQVSEVRLNSENTKVKFEQLYNGIPVYGAVINATKSKKALQNFSGNWLSGIKVDLSNMSVSLSSKTALTQFKRQYPLQAGNKLLTEDANLYIILNNNKARLAYKVSYYADGTNPTRPMGFVDAKTGEIFKEWEGLNTVFTKGPGGNEKLGQYQYGTELPRMSTAKDCILSTSNVVIYDLDNRTSNGDVFIYENCNGRYPENTYKKVNGAISPINDALYFGTYIVNQFRHLYRMTPTKNRLEISVHYGQNKKDAFWNGESVVLGDGDNTTYPLATLDIISHEVAHGLTENNAGLENTNQAGAVSESFSDITAELMKVSLKKKTIYPKWLFGESVLKGERGVAIRYFGDPEKDGVSIKHTDDYTDGMDVHHASGIFNKAFYLLSNTKGWSIEKAYSAFLLANQLFWKQNTTFDEAACGVKRAAQDLSMSTKKVINAFKKVGVDARCKLSPNGDDIQLKKNVSIDNIWGLEKSIQYYYIDVPDNQQFLTVVMNNCVGDPDMYLRYRAHPTKLKFDCRPYTPGGQQTCSIMNPQAGRYYIMLYGYGAYSQLSLTANYLK